MVGARCPHCRKMFQAGDELAGKPAHCPHCNQVVVLPGRGAAPARLKPSSYEPTKIIAVQGAAVDRTTEVASARVPTSPTAPAQPSDTPPQIPDYEILEELGRGGMGVVYKARQLNLDRIVALKTLLVDQATKENKLARFEKEARTVAKLQHPNIVIAYDFGQHEGQLFLVMELLHGEDVQTRIDREGRLDETCAWGLVRQAAAGLAHAAAQGIVHRDIKPANMILVDPPKGFPLPQGLPLVKVTDFGLALLGDHAPTSPRLTVAGTTLGTPVYMAPEQFASPDVDLRADIYSLGATAFHMLTGDTPFAGQTIWEIMINKNSDVLRDLAHVAEHASPASVELIALMMAKDPTQRIGSYEELMERIDALLGSSDRVVAAPADPRQTAQHLGQAARKTAAVATPRSTETSIPRQRLGWLWASLAVILVVGAGGGGAWYRYFRNPASVGQPQPTMVAAGKPEALFDGKNLLLPTWTPRQGLWKPSKDEVEGSDVLAGSGIISRTLHPPANFRLRLGVNLHQASAVELHFGIREGASETSPRNVLRICEKEALLGKRQGDRGPLESAGPACPGTGKGNQESAGYHEMRIERQGKRWWAFFDDRLVGQAAIEDQPESPEFRLITEGGQAYFEAIELDALVDESQRAVGKP